MEDHKVRLRQAQRDHILNIVMSESPIEDNKIHSYLILKQKLSKGMVCEGECIMDGYVELNSIVSIRTSFGYKYGLKLVLPHEADIQANKLSILSSLGCAIFGRKEGEKVKWYFQGEAENAEIIKVQSPTENPHSTMKM